MGKYADFLESDVMLAATAEDMKYLEEVLKKFSMDELVSLRGTCHIIVSAILEEKGRRYLEDSRN